MYRLKNGVLLFVIIVLSVIFLLGFDIDCLFKTTFHIPCPGCGLTRAFIEIVNFRFINSFNYNILGLPLFIFLIITFIVLIKDFICNNNSYIKFINKLFNKYYIVIIILLLISWFINIIRGI